MSPADSGRTAIEVNTRPLAPSSRTVPVTGISERFCWYVGRRDKNGTPSAIDECADVHARLVFSHIVWTCGRASVDHNTDLPMCNSPIGRQVQDGACLPVGRMDGGVSPSPVTTPVDASC